MSKAEKLLQKLRNNPKNWRIETLENLAKKLGIQVRKSGGSHVVFLHKNSETVVTVPANRPIKPIYITQLLVLIDDIMD
ncbi:type II toxin-antitoxin system HicA family toxin [Candidatus Riflebacteria bacterium]